MIVEELLEQEDVMLYEMPNFYKAEISINDTKRLYSKQEIENLLKRI